STKTFTFSCRAISASRRSMIFSRSAPVILCETRMASTSSTLSSSSSIASALHFQGGFDHRPPGFDVAGRGHDRVRLAQRPQHCARIVLVFAPGIVHHVPGRSEVAVGVGARALPGEDAGNPLDDGSLRYRHRWFPFE